MTFPVECPNCGKTFQAVNGLVGKEAKCKACQRVFTVEAPKGPEPPPLPVPVRTRETPVVAQLEQRRTYSMNALPTPLGIAGLAFLLIGGIPTAAHAVVLSLMDTPYSSQIPGFLHILSMWSICGVPTILAGIVILAAAFTVHR